MAEAAGCVIGPGSPGVRAEASGRRDRPFYPAKSSRPASRPTGRPAIWPGVSFGLVGRVDQGDDRVSRGGGCDHRVPRQQRDLRAPLGPPLPLTPGRLLAVLAVVPVDVRD